MKVKLPALVRPSTKAWLREASQTRDYSFFDLLHGYIYGRFPYFYISVGIGENRLTRVVAPLATRIFNLFRSRKNGQPDAVQAEEVPPGAPPNVSRGGMDFANTYHGKVVPLEAARQLVTINEEIRLTDLENIIPYTRARDIILRNPDHLVALDCPCRSARPNPCLPLDVCLIIGEPFASFVVEHHPKKTRWIDSQEAVAILKAENERGHVHHAFFKDAMLGRFYAICNCCDCCCGAMQAHRNGTPMLTSSGFRAEIDSQRCQRCKTCQAVCQFHAITVNGNVNIVPEKCMGCGICVNHCPQQAITLKLDPSRGEPLEIKKLIESSRSSVD